MTSSENRFRTPVFDREVVVIVGGFGSGKSEVSVNLARVLAQQGDKPVSIGDLDIINPYFRSREAAEVLADLGVKSLVPPGSLAEADLPIIIPEIKSAIQKRDGLLILDVGGDDLGARVLSSLRDAFSADSYEFLMVLNLRRPFTSTVEGSLSVIGEIEDAAGLKLTGIISNTHLMDDTTDEIILEGLEVSREVAARTGLPIKFVSMETSIAGRFDPRKINLPVLTLNRELLKPWEQRR
ncbi:MAG: cobalamin biosynthesis protein CbiA [Candidatus Zixiibacteriota bacterium]|nr:MAG: cobalamin biosynthesis protein CbiA [candidate division Zixibacteria bacterium]